MTVSKISNTNKTLEPKPKIRDKRLLVITSSGGGGHIACAKNITKRKEAKGITVKTVDVMNDMLKKAGKLSTDSWNKAMKSEDNEKLEKLVSLQWIGDIIFALPIFFSTLYYLQKNKITEVIDDQVTCTKAIIRAVRFSNKFFRNKGNKIKYKKVVTELATNKTQHFFKPIKKLTDADRNAIDKLIIPSAPLTDNVDKFWKENCNIKDSSKIKVKKEYYLRPGFLEYSQQTVHPKEMTLEIKINHDDEKKLIEDSLGKKLEKNGNLLEFPVGKKDKVMTVVLGSQAREEATKNYVKEHMKFVKNHGKKDRNYYMFVYCNRYNPEDDNPLMKQVSELAEDAPDNFHLVPFSFQDDTQLAKLFFRGKVIHATGGLTSIESLYVVKEGKAFLHCKADVDTTQKVAMETLLKGFPVWEAGNAKNLIDKKNATIVTPELLKNRLMKNRKSAAAA